MDNPKSYGDGHEAYYNGLRLRDNPYKKFSHEWEQWRQGWHDEKSDNPYWEKIIRIQKKHTKRA